MKKILNISQTSKTVRNNKDDNNDLLVKYFNIDICIKKYGYFYFYIEFYKWIREKYVHVETTLKIILKLNHIL